MSKAATGRQDSGIPYNPGLEYCCPVFAYINSLGHINIKGNEKAAVKPDRNIFDTAAGNNELLVCPDKFLLIQI